MDDDVGCGLWMLTAIAGFLGSAAFDWEGWNPWFGGMIFGGLTLVIGLVIVGLADAATPRDKPEVDDDFGGG